VVRGTVNRGGAKEGGWIGSGDVDDIERLSILMHGDCTPALERVIGLDGTDSINETGGSFSWFNKGCIVTHGLCVIVIAVTLAITDRSQIP
jgi:hypothetical protein